MKKIMKTSVLFLLLTCMLLQQLYIPDALAGESQKSVTILFTHDMHDNMLSYQWKQEGKVSLIGGYAKMETAIRKEKETDREALLVDAGDFSMGTPFQTIFQSDAPELRMLGLMGYDAVTLGNHEFDYRAEGLAQSLNAAKDSGDKLPVIVQSNMTYPADKDGKLSNSLKMLKNAAQNYGIKDYITLKRNGIKIGIFGVMGEDSASKAPMSGVKFVNEVKQAKRVVKILKEKEKAELIICLSHSGTWDDKSKSEDEILAKKVPQINVIISGHTHSELVKPIMVGKTVIGSCGCYGKNLGVIRLTQNEDKSFELNGYRLDPIINNLKENEEVNTKISEFKNVVQKKYFDKFNLKFDQIVAASPFDFESIDELYAKHAESALGNLISDAYIYAVKQAEGKSYEKDPIAASIVPCGTVRGSIYKGNVTAADAFCISSLGIGADKVAGYPLINVYLTGKELKTICEVDASIAPIMGDAQLYLSGLSFTFNPNRMIFNKVESAHLVKGDGTSAEIKDNRLYRVVAGLYSAQMLSFVNSKSFGLLSVVPKTKDGTPIKDYEAQIIYKSEDGAKSEVKEWTAIVDYLMSFKKVNNIPQIPEYYNEMHDRKIIDNNKNIIAVVENPNHIALTVYIVITVFLLLIILLLYRFIKKKHK